MKKILVLFSISIFIFYCNSKEKKAQEKTFFESNLTADSTFFNLKGDYYSAKLSSASQNRRGKADGETMLQRIGSFSYILSELYQEPIKLLNNPYSRSHYELDIKWSRETTFDKVQQKVLKKIQEEFKYKVNTDTLKQQRFILYIEDNAKLQKAKSSANSDIFYRSSLEGGVWEIQANLEKFANKLGELSDRKVVFKKNNKTIYKFTLFTIGGFNNIIKQLQQDYGLALKEKNVPVKHYIVNFKNGDRITHEK
ncbi:DUF3738 domain-containing protein [Fodinibius halophilus]|uniref:DUF3738 domain-containing protein n=1 Tax=Fodinibius halophilus TaxID=1736908 RepID=A0A6M1SUY6_9BACT|nr:DUF3738 domain-containing protein [Fodinibius halophilus]NGP87386.1 DUF3738 domain-containing protein [Fodinibius halophilus]